CQLPDKIAGSFCSSVLNLASSQYCQMTPALFARLTLHIDYDNHTDAVKDKSLTRATARS
ncbi:MAG: hypothetical protein KAQ73_05105, partial [Dehalococcoidia bacterium]|nr:hypothetical protein [Dehalococcoidia bacterium]